MVHFVVALVGVMLAFSPAARAQDLAYTGDALRKAITGKTMYVYTPLGIELPIRYSASGSMSASSSARFASMAGESVTSDRGTWWISGNKLCQRWENWLEKQTYCYRITRNGRSVSWQRNDGVRGSARVGS